MYATCPNVMMTDEPGMQYTCYKSDNLSVVFSMGEVRRTFMIYVI
jgi:hypothetical protein